MINQSKTHLAPITHQCLKELKNYQKYFNFLAHNTDKLSKSTYCIAQM